MIMFYNHVHLLIYSFNKFLNICQVADAMVGTGKAKLNKMHSVLLGTYY